MKRRTYLLAKQIYDILEICLIKKNEGRRFKIVSGVYLLIDTYIDLPTGEVTHYSIQTMMGDENRMKTDRRGLRITKDFRKFSWIKDRVGIKSNIIKSQGIEGFFKHVFSFFKTEKEIKLFIQELMIEIV